MLSVVTADYVGNTSYEFFIIPHVIMDKKDGNVLNWLFYADSEIQ